ncbi:hypothetical protein FH609_014855 [Streptomyces sp. 3MP-14]|uniref:Uncharacterized protein n=1 Tax=Streptomyces mimosae TaxID=2586635 RepID=A0A5N6AAN8_9ACTN|nr:MULTISPECIES: hypothetical protein [Streptomyces]KAB8165701.1 hypothetical protein FH607_012180 [Streptomyces mimosae]KAB8176090.1 hypothetical protein FH609_014855 [Streptomyces sp. 3MP-14]
MTDHETMSRPPRPDADGPADGASPELGLALGSGRAVLDPATGAPLRFVDDRQPARRFLLDETVPWHSVEHRWGAGHLVTDEGAARWNAPDELRIDRDRSEARFTPLPGLGLVVERAGGERLSERYTFHHTGDRPDGAPAHAADPLANDQDWHLALWLQLAAEGALPLD